MRAKKMTKKWSTLAFVCTLALPFMTLTDSFAANPIDTTKECSVTVDIAQNVYPGEEEGESYVEDLKGMEIHVNFYKVAEVDETGRYTALKGYEGLKLEEISDKTSADEWLKKAEMADKITEESGKNPDDSLSITGGEAVTEKFPAGMYLVDVEEPVYSQDYAYEYRFNPYLTALPGNYYYQSGEDEWVYDVEVGLKPEREQLYGNLEITKTLKEFNESLGETNFVFDIKAYDRDDKEHKLPPVYSNVVSTRHAAPGSVSVLAEHIPAGADVVVTEVYSGSSYEIEGLDTKETVIISDMGVEHGGNTASVEFTNVYNDKVIPGYGVTNHFEYGEDGWTWEQLEDNSAKEE